MDLDPNPRASTQVDGKLPAGSRDRHELAKTDPSREKSVVSIPGPLGAATEVLEPGGNPPWLVESLDLGHFVTL
jgi:hypothetical protein